MTLPPLPTPKGADTFGADYTADQMRDYARAAIAAHVPESAFGNIAAVPAQPFAPDWVTYRQGVADGAAQAVPVPAGWSVTYDGKRASYIYADQETAEFEAQQVGGTARAVAVYLASAPKEQP
mgnify:CR=1 FL=1